LRANGLLDDQLRQLSLHRVDAAVKLRLEVDHCGGATDQLVPHHLILDVIQCSAHLGTHACV